MSCPHEEVGYLLLKKELTVVGVIMDVVLIMAIMAKAIIKAVEIFKLIWKALLFSSFTFLVSSKANIIKLLSM